MASFKEKQETARKLVEQVKAMNLDSPETDVTGIDSGEKASEAVKKMAEARRLMDEVKTEKKDRDDALGLLKSFDFTEGGSIEAAYDSGIQSSPGAGGSSKAADLKENPFKKGQTIQMSEKVADSFSSIKALSQGTSNAGGFLVPPVYLQDLFAATRRQSNALRSYGWLNIHEVENAAQVLLPKGGGAASVGWVAENATKPSADQTYSQVTVNIFTAAGISKLSRQLVLNANPAAAELATNELGQLLGILEEQAIISGSGTGQPRGILNTVGVNAIAATTNTAQGVLDSMLDGIVAIQSTYYGQPNGAIMHPRRLAFLQKGKDTNNQYLFNPAGSFRAPGGGAGLGVTQPNPTILGLEIGVSVNIPTNLGGGTNQDAIILADWTQAHWFQREALRLDVSSEAGTSFEQNQIWYRMEEQAGFSAERYPTAFAVLTGTGLVP